MTNPNDLLAQMAEALKQARVTIHEEVQESFIPCDVALLKEIDTALAAYDTYLRESAEGQQCPYCTSDNEAVMETYFDQTCAGCVARMGGRKIEQTEAEPVVEPNGALVAMLSAKHKQYKEVGACSQELLNDIADEIELLRLQGEMVTFPRMIPSSMLAIIRNRGFPEDWNEGKRLQRIYGLEFVPPECNIEIAAGQWSRLVKAMVEARAREIGASQQSNRRGSDESFSGL